MPYFDWPEMCQKSLSGLLRKEAQRGIGISGVSRRRVSMNAGGTLCRGIYKIDKKRSPATLFKHRRIVCHLVLCTDCSSPEVTSWPRLTPDLTVAT